MNQRCQAPKLVVVIVNYRTPELSISCLESISMEIQDDDQIIVEIVDNNSCDNSDAILRQVIDENHWESWVSLHSSPVNGGYAAGNNLVILPWLDGVNSPEYFLLFNPDTQVRPGAISQLIQFMDQNPKVGICGSRIENFDRTLRNSAFRFPGIMSEFVGGASFGPISRMFSQWEIAPKVSQDPCKVDWVSGACMMVRKDIFKNGKGMDERYFLYYEETDLCLQAQRAGWECWYVPLSTVMHHVGQSTQVTGSENAQRRLPDYWYQSRRYFFEKNYGVLYAVLTGVAYFIGNAFGACKRWIIGKGHENRPYLLRDFFYHTFVSRWRS